MSPAMDDVLRTKVQHLFEKQMRRKAHVPSITITHLLPPSTITLPVRLGRARPYVPKISIESVNNRLTEIREIRHKNMGLSAYHCIRHCHIKDNIIVVEDGKLPKEVTLIISDATSYLPTHILAIQGGTLNDNPIKFLPIHGPFLAVECVRLAPLPHHIPMLTNGCEITVPVIGPMSLPSPDTLYLIVDFLHCKCKDSVLRILLPATGSINIPDATADSDSEEFQCYTNFLVEKISSSLLWEHVLLVHGVYANVIELGVVDKDLWDVLDMAWRFLLQAITVYSSEPLQPKFTNFVNTPPSPETPPSDEEDEELFSSLFTQKGMDNQYNEEIEDTWRRREEIEVLRRQQEEIKARIAWLEQDQLGFQGVNAECDSTLLTKDISALRSTMQFEEE